MEKLEEFIVLWERHPELHADILLLLNRSEVFILCHFSFAVGATMCGNVNIW